MSLPIPSIPDLPVETPAFVYDEGRILSMLNLLAWVRAGSGCQVLYSIKALPLAPVLELIAPRVDGFSVSSLFEARLAASFARPLHITTPGLRPDEIGAIGELCGFVAFNSLEQCRRLLPWLGNRVSAGLRVNPGMSFLNDRRYDPCGPASKLGVPLEELVSAVTGDDPLMKRIEGLHFHTSFGSRSFEPMRQTVARIERTLGADFLSGLQWINLGGGYLFETGEDLAELADIAKDLRGRLGLQVCFEPGKAVVGKAGYLVASVIDCFRRDGKTVAVLDTSVNHHPEAFEYQVRPEPCWKEEKKGEAVILAGCTCLAGDAFGEYVFEKMPRVGDRVAFANLGAYCLVKANRFNGYDLPSVYALDRNGKVRKVKSHGFEPYRNQWTAE